MKQMLSFWGLAMTLLTQPSNTPAQLLITGVLDGTMDGGTPKAIELYATENIPDLSVFSLRTPTNGDVSAGASDDTLRLSGALESGSYFYITTGSSADEFWDAFGLSPHLTGSVANVNGDDNVILLYHDQVHDRFGRSENPPDGWQYADSWAYRLDESGPNVAFDAGDWTISALAGNTAAALGIEVPFGTYSPMAPVPEPHEYGLVAGLGLMVFAVYRKRNRKTC